MRCRGDRKERVFSERYKYDVEATNYTADDLGRFDLSITPGETWAFITPYDGHDLCFGGTI